jgi:hypothetical protein
MGSSSNFMVEPLTLLSNNALKTMKALFYKGLKLSINKPLVFGFIKETEEPINAGRKIFEQSEVNHDES